MPPATSSPSPIAQPTAAPVRVAAASPFLGLIDPVMVEEAEGFSFAGAIPREEADSAWTWMKRDLAPDLIAALRGDAATAAQLDPFVPELLRRARDMLAACASDREAERRLKAQLGSDEAWARLPLVLSALKCRSALDKAKVLGRAINGMPDEAAVAAALQAIPLQDQTVAALLMQAVTSQVTNPSRLTVAVIKLAGGATEAAIQRAGFGPLVEALLSHAQNQLPLLRQWGAFADIDLACRAIDRFHRLLRAVHGYVELTRLSRWTTAVAGLIKAASERIEPKLRDVAPDVSMAMRRGREGVDKAHSDQLLAALNGVYLLSTVRECRDSLALNALFDQTWSQVGQGLEMHIQRNLDLLRQNPQDAPTSARLEAGIKMAELRFNAEYAEVLRRARDSIEKRTSAAS